MPNRRPSATIVYLVEKRRTTDHGYLAVSPICAYTSLDEAEKHVQALQTDLFSDVYYAWAALEVKEQYDQSARRPLHEHAAQAARHEDAAQAARRSKASYS